MSDKMVVHLNVLCPGVKDEVLCQLDVVEVVTIDRRWFKHLHMQILQKPLEPYGFAHCDNHSSVLGLRCRSVNRTL